MHSNRLIFLVLFTLLLVSTLSAELKCGYCEKTITGNYLTSEGKSYHEDCYREHIQPHCEHCSELIYDAYNILDGKKYHPECYTNHIIPKCDICEGPLTGTYIDDFWGNSYHASHNSELPECHSCGRLICENLTRGGFKLSDGRHVCSICNETAVEGDFLLESSLDHVKRLLESNEIDGLPEDIPITLVDSHTLKKLSKIYSDSVHGFTDHSMQTRNGRVVSRESHIYILSHLPLTMFRAVLAHELLHVYLFEHDLDLRSDIREGFCNLGSEMVYEYSRSEYARFQLRNMQESQDPDYGIGYRKMSRELDKKGWRYLLETLDSIR